MSKFKRKSVLDRDTAEKQVDMLFEFYDIDPEFIVERLQDPVESHRLGLIKAVMRGRLSIEENEDGITVTQILKNEVMEKSRLVYREIDSRALAASRRGESVQETMFFLLAALAKVDSDVYDEMHPEDRSVAKDLGNLFLMV